MIECDSRGRYGVGSWDDCKGKQMVYGYQYGVNQTAQKKGGFSFDLADFGKEIFVGAVTGGLASAAFYGAGKAVEALRGSIYNKTEIDSFDIELREALDTLNESGLRPGKQRYLNQKSSIL